MRWLPALGFFSFLFWIIVAADSGAPNYFLQLAGGVSNGDKWGHLVLFSLLALLLNFATRTRQLQLGPVRLYVGVVLTLGFALLEECSQLLFPSRSFELLDILADVLAMLLATGLTTGFYRLRARYRQRPKTEPETGA